MQFYQLRADLSKIYGNATIKSRKPDQIWVAHSGESSADVRSSQAYEENPILNQLFNWTIFLSKNATIHKKYFHIYKQNYNKFSLKPRKEFNLNTNKSKDFCWMVSNCGGTFSQNRFKIADSLIRSLSNKVHIWGAGIKNGCVKSNHPNIISHGPVEGLHTNFYDEAQERIKDCKFYFAFENSNCTDYVTEKFFNSIAVGAIPVVIGWWDTYRELLPGSFIHVNEFSNTSQLAEYLESLLKDETKMKKYHEWRKYYRYERTGVKAACELCQKLERLKLAQLLGDRSNPSIIPNMAEHYKTLQKCAA